MKKLYYSPGYYDVNRYKNLTYANASPDKKYIQILKYIYENPNSTKTDIVTSVFKNNPRVQQAWLSDEGVRANLRGYAITYFGQLVNDGLLDAKSYKRNTEAGIVPGRNTLFNITKNGIKLLKQCGAI